MPEEEVGALSIGAVAGGPGTDRRWTTAIMELMRLVAAAREGVESPLAVNVVFHIPGPNFQPEFEGLRSGTLSRRQRKLMVQVALPPEPTQSATNEVRACLQAAIRLAEQYGQDEALIEGQLIELRHLAESI